VDRTLNLMCRPEWGLKAISLCVCLLAASAVCSAKPDAAYRDAMAEGRKLERLGDHTGAIRAFERAVAVRPDDAAALSELGWQCPR
jgi:Flp pilus assembly protein TadD